jgi:hypothetical protein
MRKILLAAGAVLALVAGPAMASTTVADAKGDFLSGDTGPKTDDLDVLSFFVGYDPGTQMFDLRATMAGDIDPANGPGFYVIGVNTGTGVNHPFGPVGQPNVLFNQAMVIQKTGAGTITVPVLGAKTFTATITGDTFEAFIPLSFLPSTGFAPRNYGFNLWPRQATGGLLALADFAPENSTIAPIPEPAAWALMIAGFGFAGGALRRRRVVAVRG